MMHAHQHRTLLNQKLKCNSQKSSFRMPAQQSNCLFVACKRENINPSGSAPPAKAENAPDPVRYSYLYLMSFTKFF